MKILINGTGGLGNILFQIATAIHYKENFNQYDEIILNENSENLHIGTSRISNRDKTRKDKYGNIISYKYTIFSKFKYFDFNKLDIKSYNIIHNNYTNNKFYNILDNNILISGYNQNYNLFKDIFHKIPDYLNLDDPSILDYIKQKYPILFNGKKNIMLSLRLCEDFAHMKKINLLSYNNAIKILTEDKEEKYNIIIITDYVEKSKLFLELNINSQDWHKYTEIIDDDDIVQFYIGLFCDNFILSESTYHYWIALIKYIKNPNTKILYFDDTDLTTRPLGLPEWIKIKIN